MPMTMKLPDPKTGRMVTFDWPRETPPTEQELEQYVFQPARQKAQEAGLIPPGLSLSEGPLSAARPNLPATPEDRQRQSADYLSFMGHLLELGLPIAAAPLTGGMSALPSLIANMGVNAVAGGLAAPLIGKDPTDEALGNAALGAVGEIGGKVLPVGANMLGQAFGGKLPSKKDAMAFVREGGRQWKEGKLRIGLGNQKRTRTAMGTAGDLVQKAENANDTTLSLPTVARKGYQTVSGDAGTANFPQDVRGDAEEFVKKYVSQQAMENPKVVPDPSSGIPDGELIGSAADTRIGARRRPLLGRGSRVVKDAEPADDVIDVSAENGRTVLPNDRVSMRRAGDLKRAAGQRSGNVIKARKEGHPIPADMAQSQQMDAAMEKAWREAQYAEDFPKTFSPSTDNLLWPDLAEPVGPIQSANQRMSDLHRMDETNRILKDPTIAGRVGQFTTRAALGAGIGQAFSETTGADPNRSRLGGAALGVGLFNPRSAGATGNALGILTQALPHTVRLTQAAEAFPKEDDKKKKTKRKDPK